MTGEWVGDWRLGPGRLVLAGSFGSTSLHQHPALQITVALTGALIATDADESRTCRAVLIPSGARHTLSPADATTRALSIYLHPATVEAHRLAATTAESGVDEWISRAEPVTDLDLGDADSLDAMTETVLTTLSGQPTRAAASPTLRDAFDLLTVLLPGKLYLRDLAGAVALSPSSLSRLFATETGVSFPTTVRLARLLHAMREIDAGRTITDAAHTAGFTDSAHVTRVCREMTGVPPSVLIGTARQSAAVD
ncbi:helix-turn-helix domain-containing protein [Nocardia sp. NPDC058176]|uniref:helix-turn-helix transcriptional regulator n=1 Tax=Nocardia sp. NPDC058176 TaxID=3346368 RepID=UPI0036DEE92C